MQKNSFPYLLFFILLAAGALTTFFTANIFSVTTHTTQTDMEKPFPVVLEPTKGILQVVTAEQLLKLQLPDPETGQKMVPDYILNNDLFTDNNMIPQTIIGKSITNGSSIHIPTDYSAQVSARQINKTAQEITVVFATKAEEDQIITVTYTARPNQYIPLSQTIKNILIWKTIFMNGMMLSVILPFAICRYLMKKKP
jgi:hypothetical protein